MKLHLSLPHPMNAEATPGRRWWLGWAQLLLVWLLCMLLCANVALALAESLGLEEAPPHAPAALHFGAGNLGECAASGSAAEGAGPATSTLRQSLRCSSVK